MLANETAAPETDTPSSQLVVTDASAETPESRRARTRRGRESGIPAPLPTTHPLSAVGLRKSTDLVIMVMPEKHQKVSLIQRRAVNVLLSVAQKIDRSEGGSPDRMYSIDLSTLEHDLGFKDDSNRRYIIDLIRQIAGLKFELGDGQHFHCGSVIAEIEVCFKTRTLRYSLPVGMRQKLLHPERFNYLKLVLLNHFTSHSSLLLYELLSCYATHPAKRTPPYPWQQLSTWLTGSSTPHSTYREFSKLLARALDQVNEVWPTHTSTLMYSKTGRATDRIWFSISEKQQSSLPLEHEPCVVSSRLKTATARFSLKASDLEDLLTRNDEDYLLAQCDLVARRLEAAQPGSIASPRAYLLKAVADNWADAPRDSSPSSPSEPTATSNASGAPAPQATLSFEEARSRWWAHKQATVRQRLLTMSADQLRAVADSVAGDIASGTPLIRQAFEKHGLTKPMPMAAAVGILARREFKEPSRDELLASVRETEAAAAA
jgi:hypothetical protein